MGYAVDVYKNFLKQSQAVAGGGHPHGLKPLSNNPPPLWVPKTSPNPG